MGQIESIQHESNELNEKSKKLQEKMQHLQLEIAELRQLLDFKTKIIVCFEQPNKY